MNQKEILKFAQNFGYTEETLAQAVEQYHETGIIQNRAVAMAVGLAED